MGSRLLEHPELKMLTDTVSSFKIILIAYVGNRQATSENCHSMLGRYLSRLPLKGFPGCQEGDAPMKPNRNQPKHLPTLLIQQIRLQWYKDCRGGNAAVQRSQYPKAMRLPKDFFSYYPFGLPTHFVSIVQRPDGFHIDKDCRRLMEWNATSPF